MESLSESLPPELPEVTTRMLKIGLILSSPSPHQVEFLNAIAERSDVSARIGYVQPANSSRHWGRPTPNLPWEDLPSGFRNVLTGRLSAWIKSQTVDVWLLSSAYTHLTTHAAAWILKRQQQPYVFLGEPPRPSSGLKAGIQQLMVRAILRNAAGVLGTGEESARRYRRMVDQKKPVESLPYYVDLSERLKRPPISGPAEGEPFRFVASAQLIHRKGLDVLIDACAMLPEQGWSLDVFGDGPLRQTLQQQASRTARPIFFRGLLPYDRNQEMFENRHCFVFSTRWDGWGMVLPEALAMGLPVISTDQAMSAHEFITPANGQIVRADDAAQLAQAMQHVMDDRRSLSNRSIAAREALVDYRPDVGAERLVSVLSQITRKAA